MRAITKNCGPVLALAFLCGSAFAAVQDSRESVTVMARQADADMMKADLDPARQHFDGLTGEAISRDIEPLDRYSAFRVFAKGLDGPLMESYDWYGLRDDGNFRPTREFFTAGLLCRDFTEETDHHDAEESQVPPARFDFRRPVVMGTACHERDGWHFR